MQRRPRVHDSDLTVSSVPGEPRESSRLHELDDIYTTHLPAIYRFIYARVGNREEAEDLTSQVFLKALRGMDEARDAQSIQGWLFQVARTTVADHWRAFYRLHVGSLDTLIAAGWEAPMGEPALPSDDVEAHTQQILQLLPPRYREVLTYRFLLNYSIREAAEKMRLTEANVKVLQFRALKSAAKLAAEKEDGDGREA